MLKDSTMRTLLILALIPFALAGLGVLLTLLALGLGALFLFLGA